MADRRELEGIRVAIVASDGFEESELLEPRKALDAAGARTEILSTKTGELQAFRHYEKASRVKVDRSVADARPEDYDALVLPGGAANADATRAQEPVKRFVRALGEAKKPIAFICHAPWIVISAGLARGRKMTSYATIQDDVKNAGAEWSDREVVRDGNFVTSRQPSDLPAFNREMIQLFAQSVKGKKAEAA